MTADCYHAWSQSENYLCELHFELGRNERTFFTAEIFNDILVNALLLMAELQLFTTSIQFTAHLVLNNSYSHFAYS